MVFWQPPLPPPPPPPAFAASDLATHPFFLTLACMLVLDVAVCRHTSARWFLLHAWGNIIVTVFALPDARGAAVARHDEKDGELLPPATATAFWLVVAGGCVRLGRGADPAAAATELLRWRDAAPPAAAAAALEAREPSQWRICRLAAPPPKC